MSLCELCRFPDAIMSLRQLVFVYFSCIYDFVLLIVALSV